MSAPITSPAEASQRGYQRLSQLLLWVSFSLTTLVSASSYAQNSSHQLSWQILGDVSLEYPHTKTIPASFVLGDVDLWFQRSFGENWNAMGELMIMNDTSGEGEMYMIHPARLFVEYTSSDAFQLRIGQIHTPIGIYSQLYPHGGSIFEPTLHRPMLTRVKEGEDILPFHALGLNARGTMMLNDSWEFMYIVGISNGYSHGSFDGNHQKAPFFQLRFSPIEWGLTCGVSAYHDLITKDEIVDGVEQSIFAFSLMYDSFPVELLSEVFVSRHASRPDETFKIFNPTDPDDTVLPNGKQPRKQLVGGYLQASYMWDRYALYTLIEAFERDAGDYLFDEHTPYTLYMGAELGHRYHINQQLVLKSAYSYNWADDLHRFDMQLAFRL